MKSSSVARHFTARLSFSGRDLWKRVAAGGVALLAFASAEAQEVVAQQFGATAVNGNGNALYNLTVTPNTPPGTGALLSGTQGLNTDGTAHGHFFAVTRVSNSVTSALDLIVADASRGQIVRYPGPGPGSYQTSGSIFSWTQPGSGPKYPIGLAADTAGNVYAISAGVLFDTKPALWVLPFNSTTGAYGAPILIDNTCGIVSEVLVATTPATAIGAGAPAWNAGDVLVLVSDPLSPRVLVYSQAAIQSVLANPSTPLRGPTSIAVSPTVLRGTVPVGMDVWPADATHGVSLLITTLGGRVLRFDSGSNALTADFAGGLGLGLQRIKVGTYSTIPYAFIAQSAPGKGRILQFGAPPASGSNTPLASVTTGVNDPLGLAVSSSGSVPVSACIAPNVCDPIGPQLNTQISGSGTGNLPPDAPLLQESCIINSDPRVTVSGSTWSCAGGNLDVANYCPGFPSTVLPGFLCGHSGPTGSGLVVVKGTAKVIDQNVNDTFIQEIVDPDLPLPGPLNLSCPQEQIFAWAPRSDLPSIEGTVVEGGPAPGSNYFVDLSGLCDKGGGTVHSLSMQAYGLALNTATSGIPNGLPAFVTDKFANLQQTITNASGQINPSLIETTLSGYITQAQTYFNSGVAGSASNGFSCAMNSLASGDNYLRANLSAFSGAAPPGNTNPAGEISGRIANLFLTIDEYFLSEPPNMEWPTNNVPPCDSLTIAPATVVLSSVAPASATLTWAPVSATYPLSFTATQCTLSASDGTFTTPASEPGSGSVSTGTLTALGTYSAQILCSAAAGNTITSLTQATANVIALATLSVTPSTISVAAGGTTQLSAQGTYTDGSHQDLTASATWSSSAMSVATVGAGLVSCNPNATSQGVATITATSATATGTTSGSSNVTCLAPVLQSISVTPTSPAALAAGGTIQLTATGTYSSGPTQNLTNTAAWSTSAASVATVSASGLVTCNSSATTAGAATITAMSGGATPGSATINCQAAAPNSIAVTPTHPPEVNQGASIQLTATANYASGPSQNVTSTATWSSSAPSIATVSAGRVTCQVYHSRTDQNVTIKAALGAVSGSTTVTCEETGGNNDRD